MTAATQSQASAHPGQCAVRWKGIAPWVLADAGIEEADDTTWLPYRDLTGATIYCKAFRYARSWYEPGGIDLVPYGLERLPRSRWIAARSALLIVEGESDALAAREHFFEGDARILAWHALGLPGSGTWRDDWRQYVERFALIYVAGDGDEAGKRMNTAVRHSVPWARPVQLPEGEDVRSILQRCGRDELLRYPRAADADARLAAAVALAPDLDTFEALLRDEEVDL